MVIFLFVLLILIILLIAILVLIVHLYFLQLCTLRANRTNTMPENSGFILWFKQNTCNFRKNFWWYEQNTNKKGTKNSEKFFCILNPWLVYDIMQLQNVTNTYAGNPHQELQPLGGGFYSCSVYRINSAGGKPSLSWILVQPFADDCCNHIRYDGE